LRLNEFRASSFGKANAILRATLFEFCLKGFPSDALGAVAIERCEATLKLGLLGGRQLHLVVIPTVPKLRDQCKPFIRGQAGDFVMSELHWFRLADPTASVDSS
jgi:hypothetical protein